ncbi:D-2-hydroxyacid dehydrogenase family protein [Pseudoxanthomonas sp. JBR18]|uniref:D-2-hydroxyacid dehydrogenase family protein n=1 Tax=Pseudoxanthomonas sp. JBR18 TaxID=2969308 RepID=UPI0023051494|nr:D-2-hydroxyacid dehydrogenase family protein [Pseudoxanthomonas sp. JBR18]WCE06136.1 D-2-hydroxyacid dehydrogenase family protein [Pseudoxanthomonas sp. JBR18]
MRVVIPDDYQRASAALPALATHRQGLDVRVLGALPDDLDACVEALGDAQALVLIRERTRIDAALLERLPQLCLVSQTGKIGAHVDVAACTARGVAVVEGSGSPIAPAELTWALVMAAMRRLPAYGAALQAGRWQDTGDATLGRTLHGRTLGIWSYGKIGQRVAGYGRAFGMQVLVWGGEAARAAARADGFEVAASVEDLFARSDVLSLHRRLVAATRHQVDAALLGLMKPDALLVNTSRAELVAPGALLDGLNAGRPGLAALDVFEHEPATPSNEPLLTHPRVLAMPHLGYVEQDSYALYLGTALDNVRAFAAGTPRNLVNPEALPSPR